MIVQSRGVGAQKWVKCGPRSSWMTPGLGFTTQIDHSSSRQARGAHYESAVHIHLTSLFTKNSETYTLMTILMIHTALYRAGGGEGAMYFPSRPPYILAPIEAKRSFFNDLLELPTPPNFLFDLTLCLALLAEEGIERIRGHHKMKWRFLKGARRWMLESKFSYDLQHTYFK